MAIEERIKRTESGIERRTPIDIQKHFHENKSIKYNEIEVFKQVPHKRSKLKIFHRNLDKITNKIEKLDHLLTSSK